MAITILPPVVEDVRQKNSQSAYSADYGDSDDSMSDNSDSDVEMGGVSLPQKRRRLDGDKIATGVVTPGEVVTDSPQWMR